MANFQIPDKTTIASVDGAADTILIYDASATALRKATRNIFLALTSAPLGTTDAQSPTNKTFDNSNIFTIRDDRLTLQDNADTTKQAVFQLSGITTATTRTYTLPDASSTLVDLSSTQTLINKTLTSPAINTPTIVNPTITVDTISEYTAANGVTIDGVKLKDGALATNNSVVTANITDSAVTPAKLQSGTGSGWAWSTWAPTLTNLTLGNGTGNYHYIQTGKTVTLTVQITLGTTSSVSGNPVFTLPVTAASRYSSSIAAGAVFFAEDVGTAGYLLSARFTSTTQVTLESITASGTYTQTGGISSTTPFTWANGDKINGTLTYEAA